MLSPSEFYSQLLDRQEKRKQRPGPVKWCNQCGRKHKARAPCKLFLRTRVVMHGDRTGRRKGRAPYKTKRWAP